MDGWMTDGGWWMRAGWIHEWMRDDGQWMVKECVMDGWILNEWMMDGGWWVVNEWISG